MASFRYFSASISLALSVHLICCSGCLVVPLSPSLLGRPHFHRELASLLPSISTSSAANRGLDAPASARNMQHPPRIAWWAQYAVVLVILAVVSVVIGLRYTTTDRDRDRPKDVPNLLVDTHSPPTQLEQQQASDPDRFVTYAALSGFSNQVRELLYASCLAMALRRTAVFPPYLPRDSQPAYGSCSTVVKSHTELWQNYEYAHLNRWQLSLRCNVLGYNARA